MPVPAPLTLYNSLTRALEPFVPVDPGNVRVYSCGPTVYNDAHIGNLRAYVFTDTLVRVLRWKGWPLTHVMNITDVGHLTSDADAGDDKLEAAARAQARSAWDIAAHHTANFKANLRDLNIVGPTRWAVATDHIAEMIAFAERIAERHCYLLPGGLYFDVSTVPDYGRLARAHDDAGESRIDPVAGKRHPQDFAIWRTSRADEHRQMEWDSPWGRGAPGWHLECSVMSLRYLGPAPFDIHTGGIDHREIHHPNEIAQNQAYCGCTPGFTGARVWMHNNFLVDRSGKMSKSSGAFTTLQTLVDLGVHPLAYRLLCLSAHYRGELEFSPETLAAAVTRLKRLVMTVEKWRAVSVDGTPGHDANGHVARLDAAVSDDLNTPRALPLLDDLLADRRLAPADRAHALAAFDAVLGLDLGALTRADLRVRPAAATLTVERIEQLLAERKAARAGKDFARSDTIRDALAMAGVDVMDGDPLGWDWRMTL